MGSNLLVTAKPFMPLATSSTTTADHPTGSSAQSLLEAEVTRPLYWTDDEGAVTNTVASGRVPQRCGS